jgi:hypothetical protein
MAHIKPIWGIENNYRIMDEMEYYLKNETLLTKEIYERILNEFDEANGGYLYPSSMWVDFTNKFEKKFE